MILGDHYYGLNRTLCDVLSEIRKVTETHNYSYLPGLIEEMQTYANRMEAGLMDKKDLDRLHESLKEIKVEVKEARAEKHKLEEQIKNLKEQVVS